MTNVIKIGFDIGGVLSKYPEVFRPLLEALNAHPAFEVHVLTDVPPPRAVALVQRNGYNVPVERIHSCDLKTHGHNCKAKKTEELGIDVMFDDHLPYLGNMGKLRFHVLPENTRPFFAPGMDECRDV